MAQLVLISLIATALLVGGGALLARKVPWTQRWVILVVAFLLGLALDLGSKEIAFHYLPAPRDTHEIWSWFSWTHARNEGAAFGMFRGKHDFFMVVTLCAFVGVPFFVHLARLRVALTAGIMGLILAGVGGNFWDRMVFGYVRDFIDWHVPETASFYETTVRLFDTNTWPTFNVADMFITGGAVAAILFLGQEEDPAPEPKPEAGSTTTPGGAEPAAQAV